MLTVAEVCNNCARYQDYKKSYPCTYKQGNECSYNINTEESICKQPSQYKTRYLTLTPALWRTLQMYYWNKHKPNLNKMLQYNTNRLKEIDETCPGHKTIFKLVSQYQDVMWEPWL